MVGHEPFRKISDSISLIPHVVCMWMTALCGWLRFSFIGNKKPWGVSLAIMRQDCEVTMEKRKGCEADAFHTKTAGWCLWCRYAATSTTMTTTTSVSRTFFRGVGRTSGYDFPRGRPEKWKFQQMPRSIMSRLRGSAIRAIAAAGNWRER